MSDEFKEIGKNVLYKVEGDELILKMNLTKDYGLSKTGKTVCVATTGGNVTIEGIPMTRKIGINLYKYPNEK